MTIVCWDGKLMVADRRRSSGGSICSITKVEKHDGELLGISGTLSSCFELREWYKGGAAPGDFPERCKDDESYGMLMVVSKAGQLFIYGDCYVPELIEEPFYAIGSGADAARGAMHMGADALKAAKIACLVNSGCGNGFNFISLGEERVGHHS